MGILALRFAVSFELGEGAVELLPRISIIAVELRRIRVGALPLYRKLWE